MYAIIPSTLQLVFTPFIVSQGLLQLFLGKSNGKRAEIRHLFKFSDSLPQVAFYIQPCILDEVGSNNDDLNANTFQLYFQRLNKKEIFRVCMWAPK